MDNIPEITIDIKSVTVGARPRKLRATWSPEMSEDLYAYYGIQSRVHKQLRKAGLKTRFKHYKEASFKYYKEVF